MRDCTAPDLTLPSPLAGEAARRWAARVQALLRGLLGAWAAGFVLIFVYLVSHRITYPFSLECMDGGTLQVIRRILAGEKVYVAPTISYSPYIYQPLYFYVAAGFSKLLGGTFLPLRLVSVVATCGTVLLLAAWIKRETGSWLGGLAAAGFFLGCYPIGVAIMDLAKVDALFVLLLMSAAFALRFAERPATLLLGGCCLLLAFFTKQTALITIPFFLLVALLRNWRVAVWFGLPLLAAPFMILWLDRVHEGWYTFYVFKLLKYRDIAREILVYFWTREFALPFAVTLGIIPLLAYQFVIERQWRALSFYMLMWIALTGLSFGGRLNKGGDANVLLPMFAILALWFGMAVQRLARMCEALPVVHREWARCLVYIVLILQLAALTFNPRPFIPTAADRAAGEALVARIKSFPGEVFIPYEGYLATMAGKQTYAYAMAVFELTGAFGRPHPVGGEIRKEYEHMLAQRRFDAIILNDEGTYLGVRAPDQMPGYKLDSPAVAGKDAFFPVSGWHTRPEMVLVRDPAVR